MIPAIIKPKGKITSIDASTITAAYGSAVSGAQKLRSLEIFRASVVKIDNQSDTPICARVIGVSSIDANTGETYSHNYTIDREVNNYMDVIVKPADTVYIRKKSGNTVIDDPNVPTYVTNTSGETIELRLAPNVTTGTGFVYASPVSVSS
tara:strand:+ start:636 stop:1085 length:450 start_codon:yes stop_codon:yes gene_type:complete